MSGGAHPRRVVNSGPKRRDWPSIAALPENRLQPVLPATCSGESKVIVGIDGAGAAAPASSAARQDVPASVPEPVEVCVGAVPCSVSDLAASAPAGVDGAARALGAGVVVPLVPDPAPPAPGFAGAHETPTAAKTPANTATLMRHLDPGRRLAVCGGSDPILAESNDG